MRSEAIAGLPFIRNGPLPVHDLFQPYIQAENLSEDAIQRHGKTIYQHCINYLKILAVKRLFPTNEHIKNFIVRIVSDKVVAVQCISEFYAATPQPKQQLVDFAAFLKVKDNFQSENVMDYYFPKRSAVLNSETTIDEIAQIIVSMNQINLKENPTRIFIVNNEILGNNTMFQAMHSQNNEFKDENDILLWIVLARFVNSNEFIQNIELLPDWLHEYVKYDGPRETPDAFTQICNCDEPLQMLRICLGMYPVKFDYHFEDRRINDVVPKEIVDIVEKMPIWYKSHILQLGFLAHKFTVKNNIKADGVIVECPANVEQVKALYKKYE